MENIFIQMAAYRDPELLPTIRDCLAKADNPDALKFCVAWQHSIEDEWDTLDEFKTDSRFIILDIPHQESKGVCWARNLIQQHWNGETYTLQLDSHHRFVKGWDTLLKDMITSLQQEGVMKPLLTAYVTSYNPKNEPDGRGDDPWWLLFDRFTPEGAVFFIPGVVPDWKNRSLPYPSRFYSGHFAFTLGEFCKEVPHDPSLLFHGEEITIAARAYTWGYDLFAPHRLCVYHEYTRQHRPRKSWEDIREWSSWDKNSLARMRRLLNIDGESNPDENFGVYGFGTTRTLQDYEQYAGIRFVNRSVQNQTVVGSMPPNEFTEPFLRLFKHCIDLSFSKVPYDDYTFWAVAFEDKDGNELYREDANKEEILRMKKDPDGYCKLWRKFYPNSQPKKWVVWPYSASHGWCDRITGNL